MYREIKEQLTKLKECAQAAEHRREAASSAFDRAYFQGLGNGLRTGIRALNALKEARPDFTQEEVDLLRMLEEDSRLRKWWIDPEVSDKYRSFACLIGAIIERIATQLPTKAENNQDEKATVLVFFGWL